MKTLKSIISITLIFTYLLGYGHSLTPHCEINCYGVEEKHEHNHEHHQHDHDDLLVEDFSKEIFIITRNTIGNLLEHEVAQEEEEIMR